MPGTSTSPGITALSEPSRRVWSKAVVIPLPPVRSIVAVWITSPPRKNSARTRASYQFVASATMKTRSSASRPAISEPFVHP